MKRRRPIQHMRRHFSQRFVKMRGRTTTINKGVTNQQYIHGDFDKDKIKNIDDTFPLDRNRNRPIDRDSRLSRELNVIQDFRLQHLDAMRSTKEKIKEKLEKNKKVHVVSRLKSAPSIINKMNRKFLPKIRDAAGILIEADNRAALEKAEKEIRKMDNINITKIEDFYSPKNSRPYYKAVHFDVKHRKEPVEIQLKTIRHRTLHDRMHQGHKTGRDTGPFTLTEAKRESTLIDQRDKTLPHSKRKLKRLPDLADDAGSQDFFTRLSRRK